MARRILHMDRFDALLAHALSLGARRVSLMTTRWHIAGDCFAPYTTIVEGRPSGKRIVVGAGHRKPGVLEIETRCRKCKRCLRARARRWRGAALAEAKASSRTWAGTLTLSPDAHFRALSKARGGLAAQGIDFDRLSETERFRERCRAIAPELTTYIKRWRKGKSGLRYLLVTERHSSGLPHYHMLVHEAPLGDRVTHRDLSTKWWLGFERWRLANPQEPNDIAYLCKYLSKSLESRVRASQGYGVTTSQLHTHVIGQLRKAGREIFPQTAEWNEEHSSDNDQLWGEIGPLKTLL